MMPYVTEAWREVLETGVPARDVGQLTYALTLPIRAYLEDVRVGGRRQLRFADYADVLAALESVANEFRAGPLREYEDKKRAENGDVDWGVE